MKKHWEADLARRFWRAACVAGGALVTQPTALLTTTTNNLPVSLVVVVGRMQVALIARAMVAPFARH